MANNQSHWSRQPLDAAPGAQFCLPRCTRTCLAQESSGFNPNEAQARSSRPGSVWTQANTLQGLVRRARRHAVPGQFALSSLRSSRLYKQLLAVVASAAFPIITTVLLNPLAQTSLFPSLSFSPHRIRGRGSLATARRIEGEAAVERAPIQWRRAG